jgi:hypothetical protein
LKRQFKSNPHFFRDQLAVFQIVSDLRAFIRHALPHVTKPELTEMMWNMALSQKRIAESAEGGASRQSVPSFWVTPT